MENKVFYRVHHEFFAGGDVISGFTDEKMASEFCERIGCGYPEKIEIRESLPEKFPFFVFFRAGEAEEARVAFHYADEAKYHTFKMYNPARITVCLEARDIEEAKTLAKSELIEYLKDSNHQIMFYESYSMLTGKIYDSGDEMRRWQPIELIEPMRRQTLAALLGNEYDEYFAAVELTLNYFVRPDDNDYTNAIIITLSDNLNHSEITTHAVTSNKVSICASDYSRFIKIAAKLGFCIIDEKEKSTDNDNLNFKIARM